MKTIWKFPIEIIGDRKIQMPLNAEILTVQLQHGAPMIWPMVDPAEAIKEVREFEVFGTGHSMFELQVREERKYIGSFQTHNGFYVYHVFEFKKVQP